MTCLAFTPAWAAAPLPFDIPAESLEAALDAYGAASHVQVLYETKLTAGRRSTAVDGNYTPEAALRLLLSGSGLDFAYTEDRSVTLVLATAVPPPVRKARSVADFDHFLGGVQTGILAAMCRRPEARPGHFRMAMQLRIGPSGAVEHPVLLSSTGNPARDAAIIDIVSHLFFTEGPPTDMPQPVTLVLSPDASGGAEDCAGTGN
jgi:hypothetical protein